MSGPWEDFQQQTVKPADDGPWADYHPEEKKGKPYTGALLPLRKDENGYLHWAVPGVIQSMIGGATLPGDVYSGKVDPTSDEALGRTVDLATTISPMTPAARAGQIIPLGNLAGPRRAFVPTAEELTGTGAQQFNAARDLGVVYDPKPIADQIGALRSALYDKGFRETNAPQTFEAINGLANPAPGAFATYGDLHAARQFAGKIGGSPETAQDGKAARLLVDSLDQFIKSAPDIPGAVRAASPASAAADQAAAGLTADLHSKAIGNYAAGKRSDIVTGIEDAAARRTAAANSGKNADNTIRGRIASALNSEHPLAGFSKAEKDQLDNFVEGSTARNALRFAGNALGGGGGQGAVISAGAGFGAGATLLGPTGAAVGAALLPTAGFAAKIGQNALSKRELKAIEEALRKRSPLYEERLANPPETVDYPGGRAAMIRALMFPQSSDQ